jgi:ADP-ribose pyrophosphatase
MAIDHRSRISPMHPFDWKRLKSEYVLQDRWLSLRADTCQLPSGRIIAPYYVLEYPPWVNVVALTHDHDVVLVRQYRHGVQQTVLELPSGTVETTDASPLAAVQRELLEETGYAGAHVVETGRLSPNSANHANWTYCFLATGAEPVAAPLAEDTERVETVLMPLADVIGLARKGGLFQALHVGSLFFALHALGTL